MDLVLKFLDENMIEQSLKVLTSAFSHSHMNLWKCEMCATEFLLQT